MKYEGFAIIFAITQLCVRLRRAIISGVPDRQVQHRDGDDFSVPVYVRAISHQVPAHAARLRFDDRPHRVHYSTAHACRCK